VDDDIESVMGAARVLVAVSALSVAAVEDVVTLPQLRARTARRGRSAGRFSGADRGRPPEGGAMWLANANSVGWRAAAA
jgi:hypothetical protein